MEEEPCQASRNFSKNQELRTFVPCLQVMGHEREMSAAGKNAIYQLNPAYPIWSRQKDVILMAFSKLIFQLLLLLMARGQTKDVQYITGIYSPHTFLFLPRPMKPDEQIASVPGEGCWQGAANHHLHFGTTLVWMTVTVLENRKCQVFLRMTLWHSPLLLGIEAGFTRTDYGLRQLLLPGSALRPSPGAVHV